MKKIITIIVLIILMIVTMSKEEEVIIPKDAIRFRVIANSNDLKDQQEKKKIAKTLGNNITKLLKNQNSLQETRTTLKKNINTFTTTIQEEMKNDNYDNNVEVNYGMNYFPEKTYKGVKYKEGEYESLVVTLGKGEGNNFWCVLFPPLCLLEAEEDDTNEVEYTSFVKELIDKYF
jgi:stage II sporulation protein R